MYHTQSASTTNVSAGHGHRGRAAVSRCDDPRACASAEPQSAGPHGVRLRAERHGHAALEPGLRRQARRAAADSEAARAAQGRHPAAGQPHAQHRPRAARRRGRSRPLLRLVPHRRSGEEERQRHQGRRLVRPARRQPDRQPDALPVARSRPRRRAAGRRLRFRLLLRLHQQPGVAQRDAAAAADSRSARAVRAAVRRRRGVHARGARAQRRINRRSILDFVTRRHAERCKATSARPTSASSTNTSPRSARSNGS